jgi:5-methylcytosine-specific restriction endonuclease McrA
MKVCTRCSESKDLDEFPRNKRKKDGRDPQCKECTSARMREKYHADAEWRRAKIAATRQYHLDNPEWSAERLRASHEKHAAERYQRSIERGADPAVRAQRRESTRRSEQRRRAIKAAAEVFNITVEHLTDLLNACDHCCQICGRGFSAEVQLHWDHIQPLARGGAHDISNMQPLCNLCNVRKGAAWPLTPEHLLAIRESVLGTTSLTPERG